MFFSTCSAGGLSGPDFCFIFAPCGYDEPEILPSGSPSIGLTGADGGHPSTSTTLVQSARPLQSAFSELDVAGKPVTPKSGGEVLKPKHAAKGESGKKASNRRTAKPLNIIPAPATGAQAAAPDTRLSLLETLKERLGQTFFKLN